MFGASSELVSVMEFGRQHAPNRFGSSSEQASVMEIGFYLLKERDGSALLLGRMLIIHMHMFVSVVLSSLMQT